MAGKAQRAPVGGQEIQKRVGRRMVGLTGIAEHASDAGEQNEHVQVALGSRTVQVPCSQQFRPKHLLERLPALIPDCSVGQQTHAVDDAPERRQCLFHPAQHGVDRARIRHVSEFHSNRGAAPAKRLDRLLDFSVRRAPAVEHDRAGTALSQPTCDRTANAPESAGHEVGPVLTEPATRKR